MKQRNKLNYLNLPESYCITKSPFSPLGTCPTHPLRSLPISPTIHPRSLPSISLLLVSHFTPLLTLHSFVSFSSFSLSTHLPIKSPSLVSAYHLPCPHLFYSFLSFTTITLKRGPKTSPIHVPRRCHLTQWVTPALFLFFNTVTFTLKMTEQIDIPNSCELKTCMTNKVK